VYILNKQSRIADKGQSSDLRVGRESKNSRHKKTRVPKRCTGPWTSTNFFKGSHLAQHRLQCCATHVHTVINVPGPQNAGNFLSS
jgi:hypothetical protein